MIPNRPLRLMEEPPLVRLARALGGTFHDGCIYIDGRIIYTGIREVRVAEFGKKVHTLGHWSDPTDELAAAFRAWAGLQVAS